MWINGTPSYISDSASVPFDSSNIFAKTCEAETRRDLWTRKSVFRLVGCNGREVDVSEERSEVFSRVLSSMGWVGFAVAEYSAESTMVPSLK